MMMKQLFATAAWMLLPVAALAHEAPVTHAHPHGDWSLAIIALLVAAGLGALFLLPRGARHSAKAKRRDPR